MLWLEPQQPFVADVTMTMGSKARGMGMTKADGTDLTVASPGACLASIPRLSCLRVSAASSTHSKFSTFHLDSSPSAKRTPGEGVSGDPGSERTLWGGAGGPWESRPTVEQKWMNGSWCKFRLILWAGSHAEANVNAT